MRLIGVPNSPYFRRTAISLELLGVSFTVEPLSPFIDSEALKAINPVMKVPTLVCANGEVIMDSSLILQYAEAALAGGKSLWPVDPIALQHDFNVVGLALAACDKSLQIVYETRLRPEATRHQPWLDRVEQQFDAALAALEQALASRPEAFTQGSSQACITAAVVWLFVCHAVGERASSKPYAALKMLSQRMEALAVFQRYPHPSSR